MSGPGVLTRVECTFRPLLLEGSRHVVGSSLIGWRESGLTVRVVRGRRMRKPDGLFAELAAALQFPLYFGENWDALDECLRDLDETLPPGDGYVVVVTEPDEVLRDARDGAMLIFARTLRSAAASWCRPVEADEWWDRPAIPFHLVLAGERRTLQRAARRWADVGLVAVRLDES